MPRTKFPDEQIIIEETPAYVKPYWRHPLTFATIKTFTADPVLINDALVLHENLTWMQNHFPSKDPLTRDDLTAQTNLSYKRLSAAIKYLKRVGLMSSRKTPGTNVVIYKVREVPLTGDDVQTAAFLQTIIKTLESRPKQLGVDGLTPKQLGVDRLTYSLKELNNTNNNNIKGKQSSPNRLGGKQLGPNRLGSKSTPPIDLGKKPPPKEKTPKYKDRHLKLARKFLRLQKTKHPNLFVRSMHTLSAIEKAAETIYKLERLDGFEFEKIKKVLLWVPTDKFWSRNALTCTSLRKKGRNDLMKFVNILTSYSNHQEDVEEDTVPDHNYLDMTMDHIYKLLGKELAERKMPGLIRNLKTLEKKHSKWQVNGIAKQQGIGSFNNVVMEYVEWLTNQSLDRKYISIKMFTPQSGFWQNYLNKLRDEYDIMGGGLTIR